MSDLFDDVTHNETGGSGGNAPEFTVSEIAGAVKRTIEGAFSRVRVRGEVGRVSFPRSGHVYFDLKDDRAVIASVAWKGVAARFSHRPEEGMEMIATGKLSTFGGQSKYQLIVDSLEPAGAGALMAMLEARRKAFAAEGLFAPERKRPLPYLPGIIGVVTSPSGAVIRDILHRLRDRFPRKVLLWPVVVQGERCAPDVARAIRGFDRIKDPALRPDLLIVARGGGSVEDLWGFNEEQVVRAVADCTIPVISAIGHETDTTLIDHAADRRAPTPSAAAEMAVPVRAELLAALAGFEQRRRQALARRLSENQTRLSQTARLLPRPQSLITERAQRLDLASERLARSLTALVQMRGAGLVRAGGRFGPALLETRLRIARDRLEQRGSALGQGIARLPKPLHERLARTSRPLLPGLMRHVQSHRRTAGQLAARLTPARLAAPCATAQTRLAQNSDHLARLQRDYLAKAKDQLKTLARLHDMLGYQATLARGYAVVRDQTGALVPDARTAQNAQALEIEFHDGRFEPQGLGAPRRPTPKPAKNTPPKAKASKAKEQGELF